MTKQQFAVLYLFLTEFDNICEKSQQKIKKKMIIWKLGSLFNNVAHKGDSMQQGTSLQKKKMFIKILFFIA